MKANMEEENDQETLIDPVDQRRLDNEGGHAQPQRVVVDEGISA